MPLKTPPIHLHRRLISSRRFYWLLLYMRIRIFLRLLRQWDTLHFRNRWLWCIRRLIIYRRLIPIALVWRVRADLSICCVLPFAPEEKCCSGEEQEDEYDAGYDAADCAAGEARGLGLGCR